MVKPSALLWTSITSTPSRSPPRRVRLEIVQLTSPGNFNSAEVMENPSKWTSRGTSVSIHLFVAMTHSQDQIGIGFIGAGDVSLLHAEAVRRCPSAKLVGLWNRSRDRAAERAASFQCKTYSTPEALVSDPALHAVFVLTNLETHLDYTLLALEAGKHVLVEKPVGATISEIEQMKRAAAAAGRICMPGHNYIYEAGMAHTRELVETGALGRVISAYVMYNIHHPEEVAARYPGVIRQILTHHSYMLLYLAGRPRRLAAL